MGRRRYPYYSGASKLKQKRNRPQCAACDAEATHRIWVQVSWFRGEDESEFVCARHKSMAEENIDRFYAHVRSKAEFLANSETTAQ